ncbi:isochorismatase family protein [Demequina capsici]|uniref:Isochorismatase family protein n=1 Tax=Demequina capsici TaxID=3075620 RepID=A0AA96FEI5_9MICO|nr:isochorismatase family protein [Demequina sp. PMTSA13]WNM26975.1 isochorismatase family protein [Demequina sp. PMTSA13]
MSTREEGEATALVVVDVQTSVVEHTYARDQVVGRIAEVVDRARSLGAPVVWVQHSGEGLERGSDGWQLVPELRVGEGEALVHKRFGDAFEDTDLEEVLGARGVGRIVGCGAQTDACVRSTLHGALARGYDVTLVSDAHTTEDLTSYGAPAPDLVIAHTNLYWSYQSAPGRTCEVAPASEVGLAEP